MKLIISLMLLVCSMSTWARDLHYIWKKDYNKDFEHGYFEKGKPENLNLPLFSASFDNQTIAYDNQSMNMADVFEKIVSDTREEMFVVACYEKNDTIRLQISGISPYNLYKFFENHIAGVYIVPGGKEIPFFLLSTPFDPMAQVMGMFKRDTETISIRWENEETPKDVILRGTDDFMTICIYYYNAKQWHPISILINGRVVTGPWEG